MSGETPEYQPFYCEENIWRLNRRPRFAGKKRQVVFITSLAGATPLFGMRASPKPEEPIFWDYHVILVDHGGDHARIWDLDSVHGAPLDALQWFQHSLPDCRQLPEPYHPLFRVIEGETFNEQFSTDRSHMLDPSGKYLHPPPPWDVPYRAEIGMALDDFRSADEWGPGRLFSLEDFFRLIS